MSDTILYAAIQFAVTFLALAAGYLCGRAVRRELQNQLVDLRADIKEREKLMAARAKREDEIIARCFEKVGVYTGEQEPSRVIDRSPANVARITKRRRQEEAQRDSWKKNFDTQAIEDQEAPAIAADE